jgi:hypothetical protein
METLHFPCHFQPLVKDLSYIMACLGVHLLHKLLSRLSPKEKHAKLELHAVLSAVMAAAAIVTSIPPPKTPVCTSILTGEKWLKEMLQSPTCISKNLGMTHPVFKKLSKELQHNHGLTDSKFVTIDEQLAIFLYFACLGASSCVLQERFQQSGEIISKYEASFIARSSSYRNYLQVYQKNHQNYGWIFLPKICQALTRLYSS